MIRISHNNSFIIIRTITECVALNKLTISEISLKHTIITFTFTNRETSELMCPDKKSAQICFNQIINPSKQSYVHNKLL